MDIDAFRFSEDDAADIRARIKALDFGTGKKLAKAKEQNGTFDVIISTEVKDRAGEIVRQDGWDLANYKNNPIVLWGHDYWSVPIGIATDLEVTEYRGVPALRAKGVFYPAEVNPLAQQVRKAYEFGQAHGVHAGCTTSVGFIPKEFDPEDRSVITMAELLEFSFVPVPANQGVGAAARALTEDEAKEIGLDVAGLVLKGMNFAKTIDVEPGGDEPAERDDADIDANTSADAEEPSADEPEVKEVKDPRQPQKALVKALHAEHNRHVGEVGKAVEEFRAKVDHISEAEEGQEPMDTNGSSEAVKEAAKELRSTLSDEHTTHKAETIKCFKSFEPTTDKAFDRNKHLKSVRAENAAYEALVGKTIDEFEEKCAKSVRGSEEKSDLDDQIEWASDMLGTHGRAHKKTITKIAKAMCREALGDDEIADEKTVGIVRTSIAPFVDAKNLEAVSIRIAAVITSENRKSLGEAHSQLKAATAIVEALHGDLGNDEGDESRSIDDNASPKPAPARQRSRPPEDVRDEELDAHLLAKDILRGITTLTQEGLKTLNRRSS